MIKNDLRELKDTINQAADISDERKLELNRMLQDMLKTETAELKKSEKTFKGLVHEFEASHPEVAGIINRISIMLSGIGV